MTGLTRQRKKPTDTRWHPSIRGPPGLAVPHIGDGPLRKMPADVLNITENFKTARLLGVGNTPIETGVKLP
jgi:hypothetical protein